MLILRFEYESLRKEGASFVIRVVDFKSRFLFEVINLDGRESLLDGCSDIRLFAPSRVLADCEEIVFAVEIGNFAATVILIRIESESCDEFVKPQLRGIFT
ncbi:MAG: hypothetical protein MJZ41_09655 [Bacteroidaceae bacterium]|nr:hypothetical protein [Bacteroidaceae bacterium]